MSLNIDNKCITCLDNKSNKSNKTNKTNKTNKNNNGKNNDGKNNDEKIIDEKKYKSYCGICGENYSKSSLYKLPCNHEFHYDCLIKTFQYSSTKYNSCPYCRAKVGYLSVPEGRTPIKYINSPTLLKSEGYKCKAILKSGNRCGQECGSNVFPSYNLCKRHLKL
tara:strand:+ start:803 stop:1294 length:492 start_codon:yes stop_codon:yes gene_type:complete